MFFIEVNTLHKRFSREELLIGKDGIKRLSRSKVIIVGIGGVGSYATEALARAGIGNLILIDHDTIDITNVNRQIHALDSTIGCFKVEVMKQRILDINPEAKVTIYRESIDEEFINKMSKKNIDYVIDAIDSITPKVSLIAYCKQNNIPIISAMGAGNKLDPLLFRVDDISQTRICPVARIVRHKLRKKYKINGGVKVVYSTEQPIKTDNMRNKIGSISFVPPVVGMIMAGVAIRDILNV